MNRLRQLARYRASLALILALGWGSSAAEEGGVLSEGDFLAEMPLVLTVSRLAQPLDEAPAAVTVVDRQMIRDSGAWDLAEVFRLVPGMYVAYNAGQLHSVTHVVSYHGMADAFARRMQVLIDGRSVYTPLYGGVQWSDIPLLLDDIERIEVIRGPNSASYGANSFLGIINIITRHSAEQQGSYLSASGGDGRNDGMLRHGGTLGDLSYRFSAGLRNDAGLDNRADGKNMRQFTLRGDYRINTGDSLEFQLGYNGGDQDVGSPSSLNANPPRNKSVTNRFELLHWRRDVSADEQVSVKFYHNYEQASDQFVLAVAPVSVTNDLEAQRYDLEAQHVFSPRKDLRVVWGGGLRLDQVNSPLYLGTTATRSFRLARLFGNLEWRARPDFLFNLGAMAENNDFTGTDITPRLALNYHLAPRHTLRAGMSQATRTPTLIEQEANLRIVIGNLISQKLLSQGGLSPERITSRELGYIGELGRFSLDARLYHDHIDDLIGQYEYPYALDYKGDTNGFRNLDSAVVKGLEGQLQYRLNSSTRVVLGFARTMIASNDGDQTYSRSIPFTSLSMLASHRFGHGWSGSLAYYQVGTVQAMGEGGTVGLSRRWDGRVSREFRIGANRSELALVAQNLFDEGYQEFNADNLMGRRAYVRFSLEI